MIVSQIVAIAKNRAMGINNNLPWHLPEDMKFFREKTKGHVMIMGRKTFDSLGSPLPHRQHIIITRQPNFKYDHPKVKIVSSLEQAIETAQGLLPEIAHAAIRLLNNRAEATLGLYGGQGHKTPLLLVTTDQRINVDIADTITISEEERCIGQVFTSPSDATASHRVRPGIK